MKSAKLIDDKIEIVELDVPKLKGEGAIIKVIGCGLCGSDLVKIKHKAKNIILGHEVVGEIVDINSKTDFKIGDIVVIKKGEKIPIDGIVVNGEASLNIASLTGESKLQKVTNNSPVLSGSINEDGMIEVKVTEEYKNSTVSKILELVENATDKKAKTETMVSKFSKVYTPIVIGLAVIIAVLELYAGQVLFMAKTTKFIALLLLA